MEIKDEQILVIVPLADLVEIKNGIKELLSVVRQSEVADKRGPRFADYIPALQFMEEVGIKRWKFDQLIAENRIITIKKKRKVYVAVSEIKRYFNDSSIQ